MGGGNQIENGGGISGLLTGATNMNAFNNDKTSNEHSNKSDDKGDDTGETPIEEKQVDDGYDRDIDLKSILLPPGPPPPFLQRKLPPPIDIIESLIMLFHSIFLSS
jgi:hypothetical protein